MLYRVQSWERGQTSFARTPEYRPDLLSPRYLVDQIKDRHGFPGRARIFAGRGRVRELARIAVLAAVFLLLPNSAASQSCPTRNVATLDSLAERAAALETPAGRRRAIGLWRCAESELLLKVSRAMAGIGMRDSALTYFGRASVIRGDTALLRTSIGLLQASPAKDPQRGIAEEIAFVGRVHAALRNVPGGSELIAGTQSLEDAVAVLEAVSTQRTARLGITSPEKGFPVEIRRWLYRNSTTIPWTPLQADTVVTVPAATYQFRYRTPARQDVIIDVPCADGCDLRLPPRGEQR
jgi:hypothetical protein